MKKYHLFLLIVLINTYYFAYAQQEPEIKPLGLRIVRLDANGMRQIQPGAVATVNVSSTLPPQVSITPNIFDCTTLGKQMVTISATNVAPTPGVTPFTHLTDLVTDAAGNLYVCDATIKKITTSGAVIQFAGGEIGNADGTGILAKFGAISKMAIDVSGNLYVMDIGNGKIRKITSAGVVTTINTNVQFLAGSALAVDATGNIFAANGGQIYKITPAGVTTTFAGSGTNGFMDGPATTALFGTISDLAIDALGNIFLTDSDGQRVRKIDLAGNVSTLAGNGTVGSADGSGATATFSSPSGIVIDGSGDLFISEKGSAKVRKVTQAGVVSTFAGTGNFGATDGAATFASFQSPAEIALDAQHNIYVTEDNNANKIRIISASAYVTTFIPTSITKYLRFPITVLSNPTFGPHPDLTLASGLNCMATLPDYRNAATVNYACSNIGLTISQTPAPGSLISLNNTVNVTLKAEDGFGGAGSISFRVTATDEPIITPKSSPVNLALNANGNYTIKIADLADITGCGDVTSRVKISPATLSCSNIGTQNVTLTTTTISPAAVRFGNGLSDIAVDAIGNLYVADKQNSAIRKITPAGVVTTLAGGTAGYNDGNGTSASFTNLNDLAIDPSGNIYVLDATIRKVAPNGAVTTFAGNEFPFYKDGNGSAAGFQIPLGIAADAAGNVYVADYGNDAIRKISPAGDVTTLQPPNMISRPQSLTVDAGGNVYAVNGSNIIYKITPQGVVTTIVLPQQYSVWRIAVSLTGALYFPDFLGYTGVFRIDAGNIPVLVAGGVKGNEDGTGAAASFTEIRAITIDAAGNLYVTDGSLVRKITQAGVVTTVAGVSEPGYKDGQLNQASATIVQTYQIPITVNAAAAPVLTISANSTSICPGTAVQFTANAINAANTAVYQWMVNGVNAGIGGTIFNINTLQSGDKVSCSVTNTGSCTVAGTVTSDPLTVSSAETPDMILAQTITNACSVTFVALPTGGAGIAPVYQWKVNGVPKGTNSTTFLNDEPKIGDVISCTLTNTVTCAPVAAVTKSIKLTIGGPLVPIVKINAVPGIKICSGTAVTFTTQAQNTYADAVYDWKLNGVSTGISTVTYTTKTLKNNDVITCSITNPGVCVPNLTSTSSPLIFQVIPVAISIVKVKADVNGICSGETVKFFADPGNELLDPSFQWLVNGTNAATGDTFTTNALNDQDLITCIVSSDCIPPITSVPLKMVVYPLPKITLPRSVDISLGEKVTLSPLIKENIATYQWTPSVGLNYTNIQNPIASPVVNTTYQLKATSVNGCIDVATVTVNVILAIDPPNTFTPNGDGVNDTWVIPALQVYPNCVINIFNRYGRLLYSSTGYTKPWDGTSNGKRLPEGTYYYVIDTKRSPARFSGSVTILR